MRAIVAVLLLLPLAGCWLPVQVSRTEFERMVHDGPNDQMIYQGSDDNYHYFDRHMGEKVVKYKIDQERLPLRGETFEVGKGVPYRFWSMALEGIP